MFHKRENSVDAVAFVSEDRRQISWHSVEELHASGRNHWKGWRCSSGIRSIYVDFDGNLYIGSCAVGGMHGNVFREGPDLERPLNRWAICTAETCPCGSDMQSPKVRTAELIPGNVEDLYRSVLESQAEEVLSVPQPDIILSETLRHSKLVIWDIGRRCNYSCTYCFTEAHNNYESHKSLGSLKHAVDFLRKFWAEGARLKFVITGGEPTVNPSYLDLLRYIRTIPEADSAQGRSVPDFAHTTSNGSRNPEYYADLIELSDIGFSAHLQYLKEPAAYDRMIENIKACIQKKKIGGDTVAHYHWLGVRVMVHPGSLELARRFYDDVLAIPEFTNFASVSASLLHDKMDKNRLLPYTADELEFVKARS